MRATLRPEQRDEIVPTFRCQRMDGKPVWCCGFTHNDRQVAGSQWARFRQSFWEILADPWSWNMTYLIISTSTPDIHRGP